MQKKSYYFVAFISGAAVMAVELGGAKLIAPIYGTSLYVWASVLGVTLSGLAAGYFLGGWLSHRYQSETLLHVVLTLGALIIITLPITTPYLMSKGLRFGIRLGSLISAIPSIMPPLVCLGMVSPILIQLASKHLKDVGKVSGNIYAISTVGGICMTFLVGFFLIPSWGVKNSIILAGILLALFPVLFVLLKRKYLTGLILIALFSYLVFCQNTARAAGNSIIQPLYESDGLLGKVMVLDMPPYEGDIERKLLINNIPQTIVNKSHAPFSAWSYIHRIATLASIKPKGSKALVIGMAGGTMAMEMIRRDFEVDVVDIDRRMIHVAKNYFKFQESEKTQIFIDDARHFISRTDKKYDVVISDLLVGEVQPSHVFTREAFLEMKGIMKQDGLFLINFQGTIYGEKGIAARSIYKTLQDSGFYVRFFHDEPDGDGDIIFIASPVQLDFFSIPYHYLSACCQEAT